jgi:hypothetical protein
VRRDPLGARDYPSVDDEHAMIAPGVIVLDDDSGRNLARRGPGGFDCRGVVERPRDPPAVTRIDRLEDHGIPDVLCGVERIHEGAHHFAARHRQANVAEHPLGVVLVLGDLDRDRARMVGEGRLYSPQVATEAELDEGPGVQPSYRDAAAAGLLHNRGRRGSEPDILVELVEVLDHPVHIHRLAGDTGADQSHRLTHALEADLLLLVGDDHPPHAGVSRLHDTAEGDVASGEGLELERDVLEDVREVGTLLEALDEPAHAAPGARMLLERREVALEPFAETGNVRR